MNEKITVDEVELLVDKIVDVLEELQPPYLVAIMALTYTANALAKMADVNVDDIKVYADDKEEMH